MERHVHRGVSGDQPADGARDAEALGGGGVRGDAGHVAGATSTRDQGDAAGEFHIHAALNRLGIFLSPRTRGHILALKRTLDGLPKPEPVLRDPKPIPFKAAPRHQYWSADIRYLDHGLGDFKVSSVTILDNDSRAVLASGLSRTRDLGACLMVVFMAIQQHGAPEGCVTDGWLPVLRLPAYAPRTSRPPGAVQPPSSPSRRSAPKPSRERPRASLCHA